MGDGLNTDDYKSIKMGASSNANALRLATLQDKKKSLEETIAKRNQELRQLCLKEAELTGITPTEIPSEAGESPPINRRKVGTSYQLNFINNVSSEDESVTTLEVQMQLHAKMAEAAIGLANEANSSKTLRRQHMSEYDHHRTQYNILQDKINQLQGVQHSPSPNSNYQQKQKKKPRPLDQEDAVSVNLNVNDMFGKSVLRHSMRSLQHPLYSTDSNEYKFSSHPKLAYRNSDDNLYIENAQHMKNEDGLISNFYKLNLPKGPEQPDNIDVTHNTIPYVPSSPNISLYQQYVQYPKAQNHVMRQSSPQMLSPPNIYEMHGDRQDYHQYKLPHPNTQGQLHKNISNLNNQKISYIPSTPTQYLYGHPYNAEYQRSYNPLQIQPHQQYEHDVMTSGLGGYWKKKENGEMTWCSANFDNVWQRDKRCGSLDRRKNKRIHKRISPNVDVKCATLSSVPIQNEPNRNIIMQMQQNSFRNRQDNCQLVRTQSLGSVGVQTVDSVWPSDDNSSCGSDTHSFNDSNPNARKQKQKEWYETSLDDPSPATPRTPRSLSTIPSILPDVKYTDIPLTNYMSPQIPKSVLEIPAESNPSPKMTETNIELFNNNIPKNCTIVTAGHCKPYHEETKPFEMSDFYKYSTKFKKSPNKDNSGGIIHKGVYQPLQPMTCQPFSPVTNSNNGNGNMGMVLDSPLIITNHALHSNVQDLQQEMNAWYKNENHNDNSNQDCSHSTATLV